MKTNITKLFTLVALLGFSSVAHSQVMRANTECSIHSATAEREKLLDQIDATTNMSAKLQLAAEYHYSWSFQNLDSNCESVQREYDGSVREFLETIHRFIGSRSNTSATSRDNHMNTLYALVATMHVKKEASMLGLLSDVIVDTAKIEKGEMTTKDLPAYVDSGRILINDVIYLLRLRSNVLALMSLELVLAHDDETQISSFAMAKYILNGAMGHLWRPDFKNKNTSQITHLAATLNNSLEARKLLKMIKQDVNMDQSIYKIYRTMDFTGFSTVENKTDAPELALKKLAVAGFQKAVQEFLSVEGLE